MPPTLPFVNQLPLPQIRDASPKVPTRVKHLKHMIGNTPLLAVRLLFRGKLRVIYAKAEHINMTGSIKDRMDFHILKKSYLEVNIKVGYNIAEDTRFKTGITFD